MTQAQATLPPVVDFDTLLECYKDDSVMTHTKWVRWVCDCAERCLPLYEAKHPDDARPRQALDAARACATNPTEGNRRRARAAYAAAYAAANAAYAAAYTAANAAANAAYAAANAANAANAAYAAAYAANAANAADAAADAAAERQWQAIHLMEIYHDN